MVISEPLDTSDAHPTPVVKTPYKSATAIRLDREATPPGLRCNELWLPALTSQRKGFHSLLSLQVVTRALRGVSNRGRTWAAVLCDQLLVSGTSFLTTVLVGRCLGKTQLGWYALAYSVVVVLLEIQNSFIASPYTINSPRLDPQAQARSTGNALVLSIVLAALAAVALLSVGVISPRGTDLRELRSLYPSLSLIAAPLLVKEFARRACFAHFRIRDVLLLDLLASLMQVTGLLLLIKFASPSVPGIYRLMAAAAGTAAIVWMISWRDRIDITLRGPLHTLRDTWSFGMWVLTGNLAFVLSQQLYPWYLASLKGPDATGAFAACAGLLALVNPVVSAIGNYLGPATANAVFRGARELSLVIVRASCVLLAIVGVFCVVIVAIGTHVLLFLYGSGYRMDFYVLVVLAASVLASTSSLAVGFGFWALGRPDLNLKINLLSIVIAAALGPWLVSAHGLLGAAFGLLVANTAASALRVLLLRRVLRRVAP
jgi:O-antigen/teichoic acid export membrane protein